MGWSPLGSSAGDRPAVLAQTSATGRSMTAAKTTGNMCPSNRVWEFWRVTSSISRRGRFRLRRTPGNRHGGPGRPRRLVRRALGPRQQFRPVTVQHRNQFIIFDIPEPFPNVGFAKKPEMGEQLPEPDVRRKCPHLGQYCQSLSLHV